MMRILFLTSCVGFAASSCQFKMVMAHTIALGFLFMFMYLRPYRSGADNLMCAVTLAIPIVAMSYALAGLAPEETATEAQEEKSVGYDTVHAGKW